MKTNEFNRNKTGNNSLLKLTIIVVNDKNCGIEPSKCNEYSYFPIEL